MRKIRFISLAFIGFCATFVSAFFTPGTFINRTIATTMCTLLSFHSSFCAGNLSLLSDRVMAANPPVMERKFADNFANLLADRSREFDDDSSPSSNGGSVAPPYPQQPSPTTPSRRSDFDDSNENSPKPGVNILTPVNVTPSQVNTTGSSQPNKELSDLSGIWLYSLYESPSEDSLFYRDMVKITQNGEKSTISLCDTECGSIQQVATYNKQSIPKEKAITTKYDEITITTLESKDGQTAWTKFHDNSSKANIYLVISKLTSHVENIKSLDKTFVINSPLKEIPRLILSDNPFQPVGGNEPSPWSPATQDEFKRIPNTVEPPPSDLVRATRGTLPRNLKAIGLRTIRNLDRTVQPLLQKIAQLKVPLGATARTVTVATQRLATSVTGVVGELAIPVVIVSAIAATIVWSYLWCQENPHSCNKLIASASNYFFGKSTGDPHLLTFDGLKYDHQAVGEFVLTKSKDGEFEVQIREASVQGSSQVSVNTATAMKVGNARVAFYADGFPDSDTSNPLRIDGKPTVIQNGSISLPGGGIISQTDEKAYAVQWGTGEQVTVSVGTFGSVALLNVTPSVPSVRQGQMVGLLGDFNGNPKDDLRTRNGEVLPSEESIAPARQIVQNFANFIAVPLNKVESVFLEQLHKKFGDSWRISQTESLFDYAQGKNTDSFTNRLFPNGFVVLRMLLPSQIQAAEATCRKAGVAADTLEECIFDVGATGNADFAKAAVNALTNVVKDRVQNEIRNRIPVSIPGLPF